MYNIEMKISLKSLAYIADIDLLKIILSSADKFPGLYRFNSSWKLDIERENFMNTLSFMQACYNQGRQRWSKAEWLNIHQRIYALGFGESGRDSERLDRDAGELLKQKAIDWVTRSSSFSLAVIDINQPVQEITCDTTYYMMGSLIRFAKDSVEISYNHYQGNSHSRLEVGFEQVQDCIEQMFSPASISELFFKAEIVGQLDFDESGFGNLSFNEFEVAQLMTHFSGNAPIFASVNYSEILPIRFAKLVGVSNVFR